MLVTYLKCAWANLFTRAAYAMVIIGAGLGYLLHSAFFLILVPAIGLLLLINFGMGTVQAYLAVKKRVLRGDVTGTLKAIDMYGGYPCGDAGCILALREDTKRRKNA